MNTAPKFAKVELLLKTGTTSNLITEGTSSQSSRKETFENCGMILSGNYLVIVTDESTPMEKILSSTTIGNIFCLDEIIKYKTYKETDLIVRDIASEK